MSNIPSRMSSAELNLNHGPSALRPAQAAPTGSSLPPSRPPRRRSGISIGRVVLFAAVLAAVAGGAWWLVCGKGVGGAAGGVEDDGETKQLSGSLSGISAEYRPIVEYLCPSDAEVKLWMDSVLASSYIREKWGKLAKDVSLEYMANDDTVNAYAFYNAERAGRPSIALCGGWIRLARLVGALELVRSSAEAQGVEKDIKSYLQRVSVVVAETEKLANDNVIDLLNEFKVGIAVFQDVGAVSSAKAIADGICKATLAHEFGHLAAGHPRGADLNPTVSQNEERQADLFASSVAASIANGQQMLTGQIWTWYTLALAENINPKSEFFRSHPYSADRLRSAFDANKSLAASLNITSDDVDKLVAEATARMNDEQSEKSLEVAKTALSGKARAAVDRNDPIVKKAVDSYVSPNKDDLEQLLVAITGSKHVRAKYSGIAATTEFVYLPEDNSVNAKASMVKEENGGSHGRIRLFGGLVRVARAMGAVSAFKLNASPDDAEEAAFIRELGARVRERGGFTKEDVEDFLDRYEVDFRKFTSRPYCAQAEIIANAMVKATLAHEFGHLAMGHCNGDDATNNISQDEEMLADGFATLIAGSDSHGNEYFVGQLLSMIVLTFAEKEKEFSTHPKAKERLFRIIQDNTKEDGSGWADVTQITEERISKYLEASAPVSPTAPLPSASNENDEDQAYQTPGSAATDGEEYAPAIVLPGGRKTLRAGSVAETIKQLSEKGKSLADDDTETVYVVLASPSVRASAVRKAIAESGAENLRPVPGGAWLVRATKAQYLKLLESDLLCREESYKAEFKGVPIAVPDDGGKGFADGAAQSPVYVVSLFDGADGAAVKKSLSVIAGCELLSKSDAVIRVRATEAAFRKVCALQDVESVTEWVEPTCDNDYAVDAMHVKQVWPSAGKGGKQSEMAEASSPRNSLGLTGKGQIVAVCDSGLDTGDMETLHPDVRGRVVKAFAYGRPSNTSTWAGDWSDHNGHGTHVVGSVLGNGAASDHKVKGAAFEAQLVIQSHRDAKGKLSGLDRRGYANILLDAYKVQNASGHSPRIHSDSWGGGDDGKYDTDSKAFDGFTFACPDFLTVVSAGNEGVDHKAPFGVIDPGSISAPATAKNCLTVGAAESFRDSGGYSRNKWSIFTNEVGVADCPHEPIASDLISSSPSGRRGMAAFSSRGPCTDGRIKPDVVAPGTDILSMRSHAETNLPATWGPYNDDYHFSGGTSMACPLVAGTAALVRQWLVEHRRIANPDAATMKAVICAGAKSLAPGQYGTDETQEIPFTYPNNVEGWGMVDLENSVANQDGVAVWDGVAIGEKETHTFRVRAPGGKPLCILMAYSDYPGVVSDEDGGGGLINDIDLAVTDPSGKVHYSGDRSLPDRVNNVEGVRWTNAPAGDYVVKVSVPQPPPPGRPSWRKDPRYRLNGGIWKPMDFRFTGGKANAIRFSLVANGATKLEAKP